MGKPVSDPASLLCDGSPLARWYLLLRCCFRAPFSRGVEAKACAVGSTAMATNSLSGFSEKSQYNSVDFGFLLNDLFYGKWFLHLDYLGSKAKHLQNGFLTNRRSNRDFSPQFLRIFRNTGEIDQPLFIAWCRSGMAPNKMVCGTCSVNAVKRVWRRGALLREAGRLQGPDRKRPSSAASSRHLLPTMHR